MSTEPIRKPPSGPAPESGKIVDRSQLLASQRTRLSFHRTRMSADRTLMSIMRTALALIGFGFTIFEFFRYLRQRVDTAIRPEAARNVGLALVLLGVVLLGFGIFAQIRFMLELRRSHEHLATESLIPRDRLRLPASLGAAVLLLLIGLFVLLSSFLRIGPFQ